MKKTFRPAIFSPIFERQGTKQRKIPHFLNSGYNNTIINSQKSNNEMTKNEILETLKALKPQYQKDGLVLVGLFGSFSRGEEQSDSDIDIVYEIEKDQKLSMFKYLKYLSDLEKSLNHKVDLVRAETIKADLKPYIYKDLIYV